MASKVRPSATTTTAPEDASESGEPTEVERIAVAIDTVKAEIQAIEARQRQVAADRSALQARLMAAQLREQRLRADLAAGPEAMAATRAALLVASGPATQADVARQLTDLQRDIQSWQEELAALVGPDGTGPGGTLEADTARMADLEQVQAALEEELTAAQDRLGVATLRRLAREYEEAHERLAVARRVLETAVADERGVGARMAYELAPWPDLRTKALRDHPTQARQTPRARLAAAALTFFTTLEDVSERLGSEVEGSDNILAAMALDPNTLRALWGRPAWRASGFLDRYDLLRRLSREVEV
jgi:hypothetical protein